MISTKKRNVIGKITWAILIITACVIKAQTESETDVTTEPYQNDKSTLTALNWEDESTTWAGLEGIAPTHRDVVLDSISYREHTELSENEFTTIASLEERQAILTTEADEAVEISQTTNVAHKEHVQDSETTEVSESDLQSRQETSATTEAETIESTDSELDGKQESISHTEVKSSGSESTETVLEIRQESSTTVEPDLDSRQEPTTISAIVDHGVHLDSREESTSSNKESEPESVTLILVERKLNKSEVEYHAESTTITDLANLDYSDDFSTAILPAERLDILTENTPSTESNLESRNENPRTESDPESLENSPTTETQPRSRDEDLTTESDPELLQHAPKNTFDPESLQRDTSAEPESVELDQSEELKPKPLHNSSSESDLESLHKSSSESDSYALHKSSSESSSESKEQELTTEPELDSIEKEQRTEPEMQIQEEAEITTMVPLEQNDELRSAPGTILPDLGSRDGEKEEEKEEANSTEKLDLRLKDAGDDNDIESTTIIMSPAADYRAGVHQPSQAEEEAHSMTEKESTTITPAGESEGEEEIQERNSGKIPDDELTDEPQKSFNNYRVYRVTLPTEESTKRILQLDDYPGVEFLADPKLLLRPRGIFVTSATDILVSPESINDVEQFFEEENLPYVIHIGNLQDEIDNENPPFDAEITLRENHQLTWDHYHKSEDIYSYLNYLVRNYPEDCSLIEIGKSNEGKPLQVLQVSRRNDALPNRKAIFLDAGIHAREWIAPATLTFIIHELVENPDNDCLKEKFVWYFLPLVNPDGYDYSHTKNRMWRKNRSPIHVSARTLSLIDDGLGVDPFAENENELDSSPVVGNSLPLHAAIPTSRQAECIGTDLNRNWRFYWRKGGSSKNPCSESFAGSDSFSEPETQAMAKFILEHTGDIILYSSLHAYSQMWLLPWGYTEERPDDYAELFSLAKIGVRALEAAHNTSYLIGTIPDLLFKASGNSQDWAKGIAGIKYSYTLELRDAGNHGFILPADKIKLSGEETWAAFKAVAQELARRTYPGFWGRLVC